VEGGRGSAFLPPAPQGPEPQLSAAPPVWRPPAWQPPVVIEPDNGAAVAGFVTSVVSAALLVMSFGFLGVLTLIAAPFAIHYSRKGRRAIREGRTRKHAGLAQAGFVIGIIVLVLSLLATVVAVLFIAGIAGDHPFHHHDGGGGGDGFESTSAGLVT
jgi:hypothetical protein